MLFFILLTITQMYYRNFTGCGKIVDGEHVKIKKSEFKEIKKSLYVVKSRCARVARYGIPSVYGYEQYNRPNVDVTSISGAIRVISLKCMIENGLKIPQKN
jgi:hypothetical protein